VSAAAGTAVVAGTAASVSADAAVTGTLSPDSVAGTVARASLSSSDEQALAINATANPAATAAERGRDLRLAV